VERGVEAGKFLDDPADRRVAQGFLDYWKGAIYSQARDVAQQASPRATPVPPVPVAILAEYVGAPVEQLYRAGDAALDKMPPEDQDLARRLLTHLVHLDHNRPTFTLISLPRPVLETNRDPAQVERVLAALVAAGVARKTPGKTPAEDRFEVAAEPLARTWPRLKGWLDHRLAVRTAAECWKRDHKACSLLVGQPLAEALRYQDKNPTETEFVEASREVAQRQQRNWYVGLGVVGLVAIAGLAVVVALLTRNLSIAKDNAGKATELAELAEAKRIEAEEFRARDARRAEQERVYLQERGKFEARQREIAERVALFVRLVRLIGDHVVATGGEDQLLLWEWQDFSKQVEKNKWLNDFMTSGDRPERIRRMRLVSTGREERGSAALGLAHELRNKAFEDKDQQVIELMKTVRTASYDRASKVASAILPAAMSAKGYQDTQPFIKEFWRLYWSSLGMVENRKVAGAMRAVGDILKDWETAAGKDPNAKAPPAVRTALGAAIPQLIKTLDEEGKTGFLPYGQD
jgi:hypothetical protein